MVPEAETPGSWYPGRFLDPRESNEPYLTEAVERCHEAVLEAGEYGRLGAGAFGDRRFFARRLAGARIRASPSHAAWALSSYLPAA